MDKDSAIETIKNFDRSWIGGEDPLAEIQLQEAQNNFLSAMPEGTNIDDYRAEPLPGGGYQFEQIEPSLSEEQKEVLHRAGLNPESCDVEFREDGGLNIDDCEPLAI